MDPRDVIWLILIGLFFMIRWFNGWNHRQNAVQGAKDMDIALAMYGELTPELKEQLEKTTEDIMETYYWRGIKWATDPYHNWLGYQPPQFDWLDCYKDPDAMKAHMMQLFSSGYYNLYGTGKLAFITIAETQREYMTPLAKRCIDKMLPYLPKRNMPPDWRTKFNPPCENVECRKKIAEMTNTMARSWLCVTDEQLQLSKEQERYVESQAPRRHWTDNNNNFNDTFRMD